MSLIGKSLHFINVLASDLLSKKKVLLAINKYPQDIIDQLKAMNIEVDVEKYNSIGYYFYLKQAK